MIIQSASVPVIAGPIQFGTDGWRGVIAADFTFERVALVARAAAHVLARIYSDMTEGSRKIIVGYDRRFLSEDFAYTAAESVRDMGFEVLLAEAYAPTPAFSWAAKQQNALGALVITASHNPGRYSGLKVKGAFGGSVPPEVTRQIEIALTQSLPSASIPGSLKPFDPWPHYCDALRKRVDTDAIRNAISQGSLTVFTDVMHGAAAGGMARLLGTSIRELNSERDPLFGGGSPEPLPCHLSHLFQSLKAHQNTTSGLVVGIVFDGDADRLAAVGGQGDFLSSQVLIPVLIEHLVARRGQIGEVVKTISGSDLISRVAALYRLPIFETPIGYKYIAERMLETKVLLGGEESGGIGYSQHIPERDALLSALYLLEAMVRSGLGLSELYGNLQRRTGYTSAYDRIDLPLAGMDVRSRLLEQLRTQSPQEVAGQPVLDCCTTDGYKFYLADQSWLLIRFSGTEPVLRLYCEAATPERVQQALKWAKDWADSA